MDELKIQIKEYLTERGWNNAKPEDIAKSIVIEGAELLEVFQWDNSRTNKELSQEKLDAIKKELADILIYCFDMAVILDLDLKQLVEDKLELVKQKYPAHLFKKENVGSEETNKLYSDIKQSYRQEK